jgi:hypothetical protein
MQLTDLCQMLQSTLDVLWNQHQAANFNHDKVSTSMGMFLPAAGLHPRNVKQAADCPMHGSKT